MDEIANNLMWMVIFFVVYSVPVILVNFEGQRILDEDEKLRLQLEIMTRMYSPQVDKERDDRMAVAIAAGPAPKVHTIFFIATFRHAVFIRSYLFRQNSAGTRTLNSNRMN